MNPNNFCPSCMEPTHTSACQNCGKINAPSTMPHHLIPGTILHGKYAIGAVLGEGGFGITYIGRDTNLDMRVAIKEFYPFGFASRVSTHSKVVTAISGQPDDFFIKGRDSSLNEARTLAKFSHEQGVVGVRDFFNENNTAYIVMDYIDGTTLKAHLETSGNMTTTQILNLLTPVLNTLSRIHKQSLIHRDISPDNIMLTKDGDLKLLDFGAARAMSGLDNKTLSVLLKPGYAPEEQYRTKGLQGPWTDIYALCATIYKCITGITPDDAMERIFKDELKPPSEVGAEITSQQEAALLKGMEPLQKNRFQSVDELYSAFFDAPVYEKIENNERTLPSTPEESQPHDPHITQYANAHPQIPQKEPQPAAIQTAHASTPIVTPSNATPPPAMNPIKPNPPQKPKPKKISNLQKILLGVGVLVSAIAVFMIGAFVWAALDLGNSQQATGITGLTTTPSGTIGTTTASFRSAPEPAEVTQLRRNSELRSVALRYTDIDNMTLYAIGQLAQLEILRIGMIDHDAERPMLDLSLLSNMPNLTLLVIEYALVDLSSLANFPALQTLEIIETPTADLSGLKEIPTLRSLTLRRSVEDISTLTGIEALTRVDFSENMISDLSPLRYSVGLTNVIASHNQLVNLHGLETLTRLTTLDVRGNQINDITATGYMTSLTRLHLDYNNISDIAPISNLASLTRFSASLNQITDISPLAEINELTQVNLNSNNLTNIDGLYPHINLVHVFAANNEITYLTGLTNATVLRHLNLNNNQIYDISLLARSAGTMLELQLVNNNISDISPLQGMERLELLALDRNNIEDISHISDSILLASLTLHDNNISNISVVSGMAALRVLDLSANRVECIGALEGLELNHTRTITLDLSGNNISDISLLPNLQYHVLSIYDNPITDFSRLYRFRTDRLGFTYASGADYSYLSYGTGTGARRFYVIDTPLYRQVYMETVLPRSFFEHVTFKSLDEINEYMNAQRDEAMETQEMHINMEATILL